MEGAPCHAVKSSSAPRGSIDRRGSRRSARRVRDRCARAAFAPAALVFALVASALVAAAACGGSDRTRDKPVVAASIFPLADIARRIAGDRVEVVCVLPPGRSEHDYEPSPREMARLGRTRLGLTVGLEMDAWAERVLRSAAGTDLPILQLAPRLDPLRTELSLQLEDHEALAHEGDHGRPPRGGQDDHDHDRSHDHDHEHGHDGRRAAEHGQEDHGHADHDDADHPGEAHAGHRHGPLDPHFWLDPQRTRRAIDLIVDGLARLDPDGASHFWRRGAALSESLFELDERLAARMAALPRRDIVTFHASFGYFAARYGLRIVAVVEPLPGREPTARYLAEVLEVLRARRPAALFTEPQLDPRPARVLSQQSGIPVYELDPIGGGAGRESYEALLAWNAAVFERALR